MIKNIYIILNKAIKTAYPEFTGKIEISEATQEKFGHYQCNSAMPMAKLLKKNPREIAENIVKSLGNDKEIFEKIEIAPPGFINITLKPEYLSTELNRVLQDSRLGVALPEKKERIVVDFSCPNIAKEMHVGHLRSTIIGDSIARLFEFLGHDVLRLNHIGDWGTAFGMLIAYMKEEVPDVLSGEKTADLPMLMNWYRASKKRFDEDESFKTKARLNVVLLQSHDPETINAWKMLCEISQIAYREVYKILDIDIIDRGESFYNPMLAPLVEDLEKKGILVVSEGAKCIFIEGYDIPLMIQKSDGGFNYDTTDLAAMRHRIDVEKADRIIIVTDSGQSLHFKLVYQAAIKAHFLDPLKVRFDHVPFGLVLGSDGKKFKTRSGEVERLIDLLNVAVAEAKRILVERKTEMSEEEIDHLSKVLGIDAIKYADLSSNRVNDYLFSYERMLRFEGNTAPFILYSYVRIHGIKRKIPNVDIKKLMKENKIALKHPSEIALGLHLLKFQDILDLMADDLLPNHLTDYLYNLAQKFNLFFRDCQVVASSEEAARLLLCEVTASTLKKGCEVLGLQVVEKM